ncbi:molybdenum cofactor sulfurase [Magnaporthiopsis poae ATCC 64411]|uniref:Molybdenum cofactor sulfurase n=1 Tax=Magnaporthiopsis poae (strain ATCC 64411 / 73-15) TaxID=644358 RepID=A0A0C4E2X0_MAGP6|nr:molybdenum cofactor sulfurase [Magnaporthiopsis poae ATCC 64411]
MMATTEAPGAHYNAAVEGVIKSEFPMLRNSIYLDHAGTTLYPVSLLDEFSRDLASNLYGNPHSASSSSQLSTSRIEDVRLRALQFLGVDPAQFDLVFTANATAATKLVAETFRALPGGFRYIYHQASHTSLVGVREEAQSSCCLDDAAVELLLSDPGTAPACQDRQASSTLFAYSAQSNLNGSRSPPCWAGGVRKALSSGGSKAFTLLDAASLVSSSRLDFGGVEDAPDFVVLSFYKIFGFPDLGALLVRKQAQAVFESRRYFGGGTVDMVVSVKEQWHAPKTHFLHERLEDGTLPIHSIVALDVAMAVHRRLYGSMAAVASHTTFLGQRLHAGLESLRHETADAPVCTLYSSRPEVRPGGNAASSGPIVAFNIRNASGAWLSLVEFEKLAILRNIHVRTGGVCNPGGVAAALELEPWEMKRNLSSGFRCGTDNDIMAGKPTGVIRASLGAMSTISDVDTFVAFVAEFFQDKAVPPPLLETAPPHVMASAESGPQLSVHSLAVFPIKSCGAYPIPDGVAWEVRPEGLAWDREWCLLHQGSGYALGQKRYPKMALIRPVVDFDRGVLHISYCGELPKGVPGEVSVPLSHDPSMFRDSSALSTPSRVGGDKVTAQCYTSDAVNTFFSTALGVPCVLARFPPGGHGSGKRYAKARIQKHQVASCGLLEMAQSGTATAYGLQEHPAPPSPPDSDPDTEQRPILLSNESPILAINLASVRELNREIEARGGAGVPASSFRANIVLGGAGDDQRPYQEDSWKTLRIGSQAFAMLGACRRCQMVCIDQDTARKGDEPFSTLSKTRRSEGKVFFGVHMALTTMSGNDPAMTREAQCPTIMVGDHVYIDSA